jgi:5-enolpyruvylshikimate-3-phosphate synthase
MAFAPLALVSNGVIFDDDTVVKKSFPNFWNEIEKCGLMSSVI